MTVGVGGVSDGSVCVCVLLAEKPDLKKKIPSYPLFLSS